ncbi:unnamed protein product [Rotaria magnacalcarata]|nr:unnamed protein product [Rotaria magnacalcarata]CAF4140302.1 unnamed protein product [Rotaria magnacalcarata]CAF4914921.1 unnamed protein product [Rotaria magnacalcarata]
MTNSIQEIDDEIRFIDGKHMQPANDSQIIRQQAINFKDEIDLHANNLEQKVLLDELHLCKCKFELLQYKRQKFSDLCKKRTRTSTKIENGERRRR